MSGRVGTAARLLSTTARQTQRLSPELPYSSRTGPAPLGPSREPFIEDRAFEVLTFLCSRAALYSAEHRKHSTRGRVKSGATLPSTLYPLPSTAVYRVEGRDFTPQLFTSISLQMHTKKMQEVRGRFSGGSAGQPRTSSEPSSSRGCACIERSQLHSAKGHGGSRVVNLRVEIQLHKFFRDVFRY